MAGKCECGHDRMEHEGNGTVVICNGIHILSPSVAAKCSCNAYRPAPTDPPRETPLIDGLKEKMREVNESVEPGTVVECRPLSGEDAGMVEADKVFRARMLHDLYELHAPSFGYVTREDTADFDPESPNGRLMTHVVDLFCEAEFGRLRAQTASLAARVQDAELVIAEWEKGSYLGASELTKGYREKYAALAAADSGIKGCHSDRDGDCTWSGCPQLRDGEPKATGRHCPLDADSGEGEK